MTRENGEKRDLPAHLLGGLETDVIRLLGISMYIEE